MHLKWAGDSMDLYNIIMMQKLISLYCNPGLQCP
jgi:hypothetical protein